MTEFMHFQLTKYEILLHPHEYLAQALICSLHLQLLQPPPTCLKSFGAYAMY